MGRKFFFIYIIIILTYIVFPSHEISSFKVWKTKDVGNYRITLDLKGEPEYSTVNSGSERFIIINFRNAVFRNNSQSFRVKQKGIEYFKLAQFDQKNVRFVAKVSKNFQIKTFTLRTNSEFPYRVIIDLYDKDDNMTSVDRSILPTVVIDPGHGGRDSGAVGRNNTYEKDIVLDIAQKLEKYLWKNGKVNPVLTRDEDKYVGLRERVKVTENKNAVLFVSIHNNAEPTGRARGYRVYILSDDGKFDKAAALVAQKENSAFDMKAGIREEIADRNVRGIVYDIKLSQTIGESAQFGTILLDKFKRDFKAVDSTIRRAPFHVLKLAGIPGVLFECGFISNMTDERMLNNRFYRDKIAQSVRDGILEYLEDRNMLAYEVENLTVPQIYEIKPGDTLLDIASRFKIDYETLKQINELKNPSKIYSGQKIRLM